MRLESGSSALTNTYIHRVESTSLIRTKVAAEKESVRLWKETAGNDAVAAMSATVPYSLVYK